MLNIETYIRDAALRYVYLSCPFLAGTKTSSSWILQSRAVHSLQSTKVSRRETSLLQYLSTCFQFRAALTATLFLFKPFFSISSSRQIFKCPYSQSSLSIVSSPVEKCKRFFLAILFYTCYSKNVISNKYYNTIYRNIRFGKGWVCIILRIWSLNCLMTLKTWISGILKQMTGKIRSGYFFRMEISLK